MKRKEETEAGDRTTNPEGKKSGEKIENRENRDWSEGEEVRKRII